MLDSRWMFSNTTLRGAEHVAFLHYANGWLNVRIYKERFLGEITYTTCNYDRAADRAWHGSEVVLVKAY